jgi:hypothetical protein
MAVKLARLTHKIAIQLHLVAESCAISSFRSFRSTRPVRKLGYTLVFRENLLVDITVEAGQRYGLISIFFSFKAQIQAIEYTKKFVPVHEDVLWEWRYSSTHSFTFALEGGEWSASLPGRFIARGRTPGTHWIGDWVGPRACLEGVVKRKIPSPCRDSNPRSFSP